MDSIRRLVARALAALKDWEERRCESTHNLSRVFRDEAGHYRRCLTCTRRIPFKWEDDNGVY